MRAEVISIGDELTSGQRLDTNSQWLAERLGELGIQTLFHTTVSDDLAANVRVFREAFDRADVIVTSGGLGPTADDLTRDALAAAAGVGLALDEPSLQHIQAIFARRKREMPPANRVQAMFPAGSRVIPNPHGTAPGIDMDIARVECSPARIFCLPGVPAEMKEMWTQTVEPALAERLGPERRVIRHRRVKCFGVGESDLEAMLPDLIRRGRDPQVGITVSKATITLRVTAAGPTAEACHAHMEPTLRTIHECLGELVYGEEDDELQHVVARELAAQRMTVAAAEAGTNGLLNLWLADSCRRSRVYRGGLTRIVDPPTDAGAWAESVRELFQADVALVVGPYPPDFDPGKPAGEVSLALATPGGTRVQTYSLAGHPDIIQPRTAKQALNLLRLWLRELKS